MNRLDLGLGELTDLFLPACKLGHLARNRRTEPRIARALEDLGVDDHPRSGHLSGMNRAPVLSVEEWLGVGRGLELGHLDPVLCGLRVIQRLSVCVLPCVLQPLLILRTDVAFAALILIGPPAGL